MRLLGSYKNGNYTVTIFDDGTKIRRNNLDFFDADTVESMDLKITNSCDMNCPMCHEDSKVDGNHGDILSPSFLDTLHPFTELAIGGGNPLSHPDLEEFLTRCKERKLIPSMTVNQVHLMRYKYTVEHLVRNNLIYGLGISLTKEAFSKDELAFIRQLPNAVIHVIVGLVSLEQLDALKDNDFKILILGYKEFRRGIPLYHNQQQAIETKKRLLASRLGTILDEQWFRVVSFDNLALKQLDVQSHLNQKEWEEFYMGDDGQDGKLTSATMYVDMVNRTFARNSCAPLDKRYPILETAEKMFEFLKENK